MTEEEILRKKLDRLNENSHYGIGITWNIDQKEIARIIYDYIERLDVCSEYDRLNCPKPPIYIGPVKVKSLKERLEEATMHSDCEFCVKRDICTRDVPKPCRYRYTEEERIADQASDNYGSILAGMYLHKTYQKKKEDNEMKPTSVQNIKNVKDVSFLLANDPVERESKFTIVASTNDDIFEFNFEGPDLLKSCEAAGLFTGWEKEQKIRKLEKENKNLRIQVKVLNDIKKENAELKDKLLKVLWTVADCEINKGGYKDE